MPVILVFIIIAGMFVVVLLPVNIEIYGTVTDDEGNPLDHVYMEVYSSDDINVAEGGVDSQGHFSLFIHHYGEYEVWATMPSGYWAQFQKVKFESRDNNLRQEMNFQLTPDIPCNVTLLASYWSVNLTHSSVSWGYSQQGPISTLVEAFDQDRPLDETFTYASYGRNEGSGYSEGGHVLLIPCMITGSYSSTPGEVVSCSVMTLSQGASDIPAADYLYPENASGGWIEELQPQSSRELKIWPDRNYTLPDALSVHVDVDVLGKRFETILPCTVLGRNPDTLFSSWVNVTNLDSVPHSYKFFVEGGHIIHIWEIS